MKNGNILSTIKSLLINNDRRSTFESLSIVININVVPVILMRPLIKCRALDSYAWSNKCVLIT